MVLILTRRVFLKGGVLAAAVLAVLLAFPVASACHGTIPEGEWTGCPAYTHSVGDEEWGAAFNERGQAAVYTPPMYVFWDSTPGLTNDGYMWSMWIYFESNGEPGAQRADGYCQQASDDSSDTYLC